MKLEEIIRKSFKLPLETIIKDDHGPGELEGWDSLGHVILMNNIQKDFSISLDMDEIIEIETVSDIKDLLKKKNISNF